MVIGKKDGIVILKNGAWAYTENNATGLRAPCLMRQS